MQTIEPAEQLNMKYYKNVLRQRRFKHVITAIYSMTSTLIVLCAIPLSCDFGKLNLTVDCALPEKWWDACAVKGCDMNAVWNFLSIWCILICMSRFPLKTKRCCYRCWTLSKRSMWFWKTIFVQAKSSPGLEFRHRKDFQLPLDRLYPCCSKMGYSSHPKTWSEIAHICSRNSVHFAHWQLTCYWSDN